MKMQHCLRIATENYAFYEDQSTECKCRCVDDAIPLTSTDLRFSHHAQPHSHPTSIYALSSSEQHSSFISDSNSDTNSSASQSSKEAIFAPQDNHLNHATNCNIAKPSKMDPIVCERYQLSNRARAAIATSTPQDMEMVTEKDKSFVIDPNKLRRGRGAENEFVKNNFSILNLLLDCILTAEKMQPRL